MKLLRRYGWPFVLFTAIGLLFFSYHYLNDLADGRGGTLFARFIEEMTGVYCAAILLPAAIWFVRRFSWPLQVPGALAFTTAHTSLMAVSRAILFPLAGLGHYDYGIMRYRYPMEASQDVIIYAIVVGFVYFYDRTRAARQAEIEAARLQTELAQAKLENLRLQLQPHFLFNTLNAVSSVMYEDVRKADAMLARLSEFLRIVLSTGDAQEIALDEELQIERMYVDVMKARLENALQLRIQAEPDARLGRVPPLLLQPIVENAIRHGMTEAHGELEITVEAIRRGAQLEIRVRDNGTGLREAAPAFGHGLANVQSRLAHLHGAAALVHIAQLEPCGAELCLLLPYRV
ncbi:MAG TPA: histidine kinase [Candidatus Baltobacteraceae bacterium]|nr:histidine kinase [Candidatus Baltobacteraceae bacterium]